MTSPQRFDLQMLLEDPVLVVGNRRPFVLWLFALALCFGLASLFLVGSVFNEERARLQAQLSSLEEEEAAALEPPAEAKVVQETIARLQHQLGQTELAANLLAQRHIDWPVAVTTVRRYDDRQLSLSSMMQNGMTVTLEGEALGDGVVMQYAKQLDESGLFQRVAVQSITLLPAATGPAGGNAGATGASEGRDDFEPDENAPPTVTPGEKVQRIFDTETDVDYVKFLANADTRYRVRTMDLAPGVDTVLALNIGRTLLDNNDREDDDLASEIVFQAPGEDSYAVVQIRNRGQSGPSMTYVILVEEVSSTSSAQDDSEVTGIAKPIPGAARLNSLSHWSNFSRRTAQSGFTVSFVILVELLEDEQ